MSIKLDIEKQAYLGSLLEKEIKKSCDILETVSFNRNDRTMIENHVKLLQNILTDFEYHSATTAKSLDNMIKKAIAA